MMTIAGKTEDTAKVKEGLEKFIAEKIIIIFV
jgi:RNA binding exosome subunit